MQRLWRAGIGFRTWGSASWEVDLIYGKELESRPKLFSDHGIPSGCRL